MCAATSAVLNLPELLEMILLKVLPHPRDAALPSPAHGRGNAATKHAAGPQEGHIARALLRSQRISRIWYITITNSRRLQERFFFREVASVRPRLENIMLDGLWLVIDGYGSFIRMHHDPHAIVIEYYIRRPPGSPFRKLREARWQKMLCSQPASAQRVRLMVFGGSDMAANSVSDAQYDVRTFGELVTACLRRSGYFEGR
jgi:hypothetical protein